MNLRGVRARKRMIMTNRFTNETWEQSKRWREKHLKRGCLYPSPRVIAQNIPYNTTLYVIEMNNDTNQIMGIGVMTNAPSQPRTIYPERNYNRFTYSGPIRIDRSEMAERMVTVGAYSVEFLTILEAVCFKGSTHSKRGTGITKLPQAVLDNSYVNFNETLHEIVSPWLNEHNRIEEKKKDIKC